MGILSGDALEGLVDGAFKFGERAGLGGTQTVFG